MDFVVAANNGTHVYRAVGLEKPTLLRSLPPAQGGNPHCLVANATSGAVAVLLQSGSAALWGLGSEGFSAGGGGGGGEAAGGGGSQLPCEITPQSGPITRCYFSPRGSFLVTWEPLGKILRVEQPAPKLAAAPQTPGARGGGGTGYPAGANGGSSGAGGGGSSSSAGAKPGLTALTKAENLSVWAIARRPEDTPAEFSVEVERDGKQRLGVNVDHLDGRSGLLIRRVDTGLIESHNRGVFAADDCARLVLPGDRVLAVNDVASSAGAQAMAQEIQQAQRLRLLVRRGPGWAFAFAAVRFFAPHISPLRWPPVVWSTDEKLAFRGVSNEVLVLDGRLLTQLRRIQIDNISQIAVSPGSPSDPGATALAAFCPASTSASPAMVRVFTDFGKAAKPALTKSFFSDAAWVTMRWDPCTGTDLLVLFHSSELTEADVEGRTLHGQGGNGLYLLRAQQSSEPICALAGSQDGVVLDVQWCPIDHGDTRSLVVLQGPQPAVVSVFSYSTRGNSGVPKRVNLGRFGVRNCLRWDPHGCSFCLRVQSLRGAGISSEGDAIDLFDAAVDGGVARRAGASVAGKRDGQKGIGPSVTTVDFSPDGKVLLAAVEAHFGAELRFMSVADGSTLYRLRFDEVYGAFWRPTLPSEHPAPRFDPPPPQARLGSLSGNVILEVELRDRETVRRRVKALQGTEAEPETTDEPDKLIWEIQSAWGTHLLESRLGENWRDIARRFCRENHMDLSLATPLAERMEQRLRGTNQSCPGSEAPVPQQPALPKRKGPKPKVIDFGDKDAVRRRVRALQKKLREIEKLKLSPDGPIDHLQREKLASEGEVRAACFSLERELDLLERIPRMVFDVETEEGARYLEFRDGDDCYELAKQFCRQHALDKDLIKPLAEHMEQKLRDQAIIQED